MMYVYSNTFSDNSKVNLTENGLNQNYELGVFVKDKDFAFKLEKIIRRMLE